MTKRKQVLGLQVDKNGDHAYQRNVQCPKFTSQLAVDLKSDLLSDTSQFVLLGYRTGIDHLKGIKVK